MGPAAATMFVRIQKSPAGIDPVVIVAFGEVIQAVKDTAETPAGRTDRRLPSTALPAGRTLVTAAVVALVLLAAAAGCSSSAALGDGARPW